MDLKITPEIEAEALRILKQGNVVELKIEKGVVVLVEIRRKMIMKASS